MKLHRLVITCFTAVIFVLQASAQDWRHLSTVQDGDGSMSTNTVIVDGIAYTNVSAGSQPGGIHTSSSNEWINHAGFLQAVDIKRPGLDLDGDGVIDELDADNDNDRLSDADEVSGSQFDPSAVTDVNNPDTDGDSMIDGFEYIAGSDPTDDQSYFYVTGIAVTNGIDVEFDSINSRAYTLERRSDLDTSVWVEVSGQVDVAGSGGILTMTDTNAVADERGYYRVNVHLP